MDAARTLRHTFELVTVLLGFVIFLIISISFLSPEFVLNKFYPKYNYQDIYKINSVKLDPTKEVRFKVTRPSPYGERYKLFVINSDAILDIFKQLIIILI